MTTYGREWRDAVRELHEARMAWNETSGFSDDPAREAAHDAATLRLAAAQKRIDFLRRAGPIEPVLAPPIGFWPRFRALLGL